MKKWITAIVTATALLMALAGCASEKKDSQLETPVADSGKSVAQQAQTAESAIEIALNHAGKTREEVTRLRNEYDVDDGVASYEVEFVHEDTEYAYDIQAETGAILKVEKETEKKPASGTTAKSSTTTTKPTVISKNEAKNIALKHAGVSSPRDLEVERDRENGKEVYEVSFESGKTEYDYHIDAYSGKILKSEKETDD